MNITNITDAIKLVTQQIEIEKKKVDSDQPESAKSTLITLKDQFDALDVDGDKLKTLKATVVRNINEIAECSHEHQIMAESIKSTRYERNEIDGINEEYEAADHSYSIAKEDFTDHKSEFNLELLHLSASLKSFNRAVGERLVSHDSSLTF